LVSPGTLIKPIGHFLEVLAVIPEELGNGMTVFFRMNKRLATDIKVINAKTNVIINIFLTDI